MNVRNLLFVALCAALTLCLCGCQSDLGVIGSADGPVTVLVAEADDDSAPDDADALSDSGEPSEPDAAPEVSPSVTLTLCLLAGPWVDAVRDALPVFEDAHNAVCEVRELSRDELYDALARSDTPSDLIMVHSSHMPEFTQNGRLANLSALGYKLDDDFIPSVTEICTNGSTVTLAPWYANVTVLLCNKEALLASHTSIDRMENLEDLLSLCKDAKKRGKNGFLRHQTYEDFITMDFLPILRSFDGWIVDRNLKPTIYTKKFQDAVNYFIELSRTGTDAPGLDFRTIIDNGDAVTGFVRSDWYIPSAYSASTYISFPGAAALGDTFHSTGICTLWGLGIPVDSAQPELAEQLLEYLMNPNIYKATLPYGVTPCRYSILRDPEILEEYPHFEKVCTAMENSQYAPPLVQWPQMCDILGEELEKMMAGRKKVTEGLADAQSRMETLLAS